ncbi:MAG: molybdenum cofactor biosynthesis protein MoaE [Desulfobulbaceae bacterium]|nr:molybdenum cofactor biosynthesis protein MoaE [Desulfobulbaceae bacterium]
MDISQTIAGMKENPDFGGNVGMVLVHNGVVRGWSRKDGSQVEWLEVTPDYAKIEALRQEYLKMEGVFDIAIEASSGRLQVGDDLLFIIVAGDIRENVIPALSGLLDRIKREAVDKTEIGP